MGNYKFRLSDMIPNSWLYKLKDMNKPVNNKTHNHNNNKIKKQLHAQSSSSPSSLSSSAPQPPSSQITKLPHLSDQRKSYYFTREITFHPISPTKTATITTTRPPVSEPDPPRKSSRRPRRRARTRQPKTPSDHPTISSSDDKGSASDDDASCTKCQAENDVVVINGLPPIITKKPERAAAAAAPAAPSSTSPGLKLRTNTPKIANRRISQGRKSSAGGGARRSVSSESFAVVKKSRDPGRDFRESMVEMIVENNIRASKDLEELLACYLSLNSDEYHELIINVFKQIWFDFIRFRLKS